MHQRMISIAHALPGTVKEQNDNFRFHIYFCARVYSRRPITYLSRLSPSEPKAMSFQTLPVDDNVRVPGSGADIEIDFGPPSNVHARYSSP